MFTHRSYTCYIRAFNIRFFVCTISNKGQHLRPGRSVHRHRAALLARSLYSLFLSSSNRIKLNHDWISSPTTHIGTDIFIYIRARYMKTARNIEKTIIFFYASLSRQNYQLNMVVLRRRRRCVDQDCIPCVRLRVQGIISRLIFEFIYLTTLRRLRID